MIDLLYTYSSNGPGKVVNNLKLGFNALGVEYRDNPENADQNNNAIALQWHNNIFSYNPEKLIIGPNICTLPVDNKFVIEGNYKKILVPSQWVYDLYSKWLPNDKMFVWPVGIDTNFFSDKSQEKKEFDCLIYFKRRSLEDLLFIENFLKSKNQTYNTITYGSYKEEDFLDLISKSRYGIIIDNTESQGIAIQEMMSCNLPLFVWDFEYWTDRGEPFQCKATSIPFWNERCGVFTTKKENVQDSIENLINNLDFFNPRSYIIENLSLEKKAKDITNILN